MEKSIGAKSVNVSSLPVVTTSAYTSANVEGVFVDS